METFTNEFINALRDGGIRSFKDRYRSTDILLIDDIQSLQGREQTQEEFFHTFNALHDSGKQIVISSDRPPKAIATLEDRLRSRFEMGLITDVQPPDLETRIAILQKRVRADRYEIHDPEVLPFIAGRVSTNVRALEGALTRVVAHGSISGRRITVELAHEVLEDLFPAGEGILSIEVIQGEVCRYYGVTLDELTGDKRTRRIVGPRQVAMYLSRELTDASLPAIGRAFGGRDHTTVMYAVQKVANQMGGEGEVLTAVQTLTGRLTGRRAARDGGHTSGRQGAFPPHAPPPGRRAPRTWGRMGRERPSRGMSPTARPTRRNRPAAGHSASLHHVHRAYCCYGSNPSLSLYVKEVMHPSVESACGRSRQSLGSPGALRIARRKSLPASSPSPAGPPRRRARSRSSPTFSSGPRRGAASSPPRTWRSRCGCRSR